MTMEKYNQKKVYIISGPSGVGKSTIAKSLAAQLSHSAYISGDLVSEMYTGGKKNLRKSKRESALIWYNILSLTKNFIMFNIDTIIDYVTFPNEAMWLYKHLNSLPVEISYVVLWADQQTLSKRDNRRPEQEQIKDRSLLIHNQFLDTKFDQKHYLDTTDYSLNEVSFITNKIMTDRTFLLD